MGTARASKWKVEHNMGMGILGLGYDGGGKDNRDGLEKHATRKEPSDSSNQGGPRGGLRGVD